MPHCTVGHGFQAASVGWTDGNGDRLGSVPALRVAHCDAAAGKKWVDPESRKVDFTHTRPTTTTTTTDTDTDGDGDTDGDDSADESVELTNWSGTHSVATDRFAQPTTLSEIEDAIAAAHTAGLKLRVVGSAISPNGCGLSEHGMLSLSLWGTSPPPSTLLSISSRTVSFYFRHVLSPKTQLSTTTVWGHSHVSLVALTPQYVSMAVGLLRRPTAHLHGPAADHALAKGVSNARVHPRIVSGMTRLSQSIRKRGQSGSKRGRVCHRLSTLSASTG